MDSAKQPVRLWEYDPTCPVDFRLEDARRLAEGKPLKWADPDDPTVLQTAKYLRAMKAATTARERVAARARFPFIRATIDFSEEKSLRRAEVAARLLVGQSDRQIAARCKIRPKLVGYFERLFFSVRHCLEANDYLTQQAVGLCRWNGFRNDQLAEFWSWCSLAGGVVLLDLMVRRIKDVLTPGEPPTLLAYFDRRTPLAVQGFVAASVLPLTEQTAGVWVECGSRLSRTEDEGDEAFLLEHDTQRRVLIRVARAHLAGKPLPIKRLVPASKPTKTQKGDHKTTSKPRTPKIPSPSEIRALMEKVGIELR